MYTKGIFGTHLYLPIDELQTPIKKLKAKLTAKPKYSELASIPMFDESREGYFGIPRYYGVRLTDIENLEIEVSDGQPAEHVFTSTLRDNQTPLYTEFVESVVDGKTGFILKARTGCIVGDMIININRAKKGGAVSIRHLYLKYHGLSSETMGPVLDKSIPTKVRSYCKDKDRIHLHEIDDVVYSGEKTVYELTLEGGQKLTATSNHSIKTQNGWKSLISLKPKIDLVMIDSPLPKKSKVKRGKNNNDNLIRNLRHHPFAIRLNTPTYTARGWTKSIEYHRGVYEAYINNLSIEEYKAIVRYDEERSKRLKFMDSKVYEIHHKDGNHQNNNIENLERIEKITYRKLHSDYSLFGQGIPEFSRVESVKYVGKKDTYDIVCKDPYRNFVANGIVVHNSGKTVLLLKFLATLGRNALIIVPTVGLLEQWQDMIVEHTAYTESDIGHVQADICSYKDKPITIGIIHSLCKDKYGEAFKKHFGVLVIDEIQRTGAEYFSTVVSMFTAMYRIGASGTLSRADGMEQVFLNHIGEKIIALGSEREEENRPKILVVGYKGARKFIPGWAHALDKVRKRGVIISALAKDNKRNNTLVSLITVLALSGRRVLVLSDRIEQLRYMLSKTNEAHKPMLYISTTPQKQKEDIIKNSGIIYATYGVFATGMDVPDLAGLVFATPQSRVRQAIGRISRLCKDKKRPTIVDLVDKDIKECVNWYQGRVSEYNHPDVKGMLIIT